MNMSRIFLGVAGMGVAAFFYKNALSYPDAAAQMPLIYSVAVGLLSLAMIVAAFSDKKSLETVPVVDKNEGQASQKKLRNVKGKVSVALIFAFTVLYIPLIDALGYLASTVMFMAATLLVLRTVTLKFSMIGIVALVTVICLVFIVFLGLPIPLLPSFI